MSGNTVRDRQTTSRAADLLALVRVAGPKLAEAYEFRAMTTPHGWMIFGSAPQGKAEYVYEDTHGSVRLVHHTYLRAHQGRVLEEMAAAQLRNNGAISVHLSISRYGPDIQALDTGGRPFIVECKQTERTVSSFLPARYTQAVARRKLMPVYLCVGRKGKSDKRHLSFFRAESVPGAAGRMRRGAAVSCAEVCDGAA